MGDIRFKYIIIHTSGITVRFFLNTSITFQVMYVCMYVFMVVWLYGCMVVWLYGFMVVWLYGCMVVCMYIIYRETYRDVCIM